MFIDKLDEKILHYLSIGANSYDELAKLCNVTRSTVYRRIRKLEKEKIIVHKMKFAVDITKLDITPLAVEKNSRIVMKSKRLKCLKSFQRLVIFGEPMEHTT